MEKFICPKMLISVEYFIMIKLCLGFSKGMCNMYILLYKCIYKYSLLKLKHNFV